MKTVFLILSLLFSSAVWSAPRIIGMECQDYWDELKVAGIASRFMDPITLSDLDLDVIKDLINPAGEASGIERGSISMMVSVNACTYSRTGNVLVSCKDDSAINGTISFRHHRVLGPNHGEEVHVDRSMGVQDVKLEIVMKDAPNEKGVIVNQPVMILTFKASVADGRTVNYKHERAFGEVGADNQPGMNWGRRCSFITHQGP